jgi:hypothetical protein
MNAAADQARDEAERIVNANAAANADVPPVLQAPPVIPLVVPAAALPPAQVVIGNAALAQLLAACQPQPHTAGAILPKQAGSTRLKVLAPRTWWNGCLGKHTIWKCVKSMLGPTPVGSGSPERLCLKKQPDTRPTSSLSTLPTWPPSHRPGDYLAGPHCKIPREVHAGRGRSVLPRRVQHREADFV